MTATITSRKVTISFEYSDYIKHNDDHYYCLVCNIIFKNSSMERERLRHIHEHTTTDIMRCPARDYEHNTSYTATARLTGVEGGALSCLESCDWLQPGLSRLTGVEGGALS